MNTTLEALMGITGYPVPGRTLEVIALKRGLDLYSEPDWEVINSAAFHLCEADLLMWLFRAPNVSQGGQSYNFSEDQRKMFRSRARALYTLWGDENDGKESGIQYGYKGSRL